MRPVSRDEILDYLTYNDQRDGLRTEALAAKADRRLNVGPYLCLLFENTVTLRYQVHEMMRVERIVREAAIQHEIDTYNELVGGPGELCATLLIGIPDEATRQVLLTRWMGLNDHIYARMEDGSVVRPTWDPRQVGEDRLSSVQYLTFPFGERAPVSLGCDWDEPELLHELTLSPGQRSALQADLDGV